MKNKPTPETDAEHAQFAMGGFTLDFCRKLERERDEAREVASGLAKQAERLRKERDELRESNRIMAANAMFWKTAKLLAVTERVRLSPEQHHPHLYAVQQGFQGLHLIRVIDASEGFRTSQTFQYVGLYRTKSELIQALLECPPEPMTRDEVNQLLERLG